jgi:hypothetical protein
MTLHCVCKWQYNTKKDINFPCETESILEMNENKCGQWEASPKFWNWSILLPVQKWKYLCLITLIGQVRNDMLQYAHPVFPPDHEQKPFWAHLPNSAPQWQQSAHTWLRQPIPNSTYEYFLLTFTSVYKPQRVLTGWRQHHEEVT